jgi:hypothetical protein
MGVQSRTSKRKRGEQRGEQSDDDETGPKCGRLHSTRAHTHNTRDDEETGHSAAVVPTQ